MTLAIADFLVRRPAAAVMAVGTLFAVGFIAAAVGAGPSGAAAARAGVAVPAISKPGADGAAAVSQLAEMYAPAPAAASSATAVATAEEEAARAQTDIVSEVRGGLTAIVYRDGESGRALWMVDRAGPVGARRRIALGEEVSNGWRVTDIASQSLTLTREGETLTVSVYAPTGS
jgi:hypothetical protein